MLFSGGFAGGWPSATTPRPYVCSDQILSQTQCKGFRYKHQNSDWQEYETPVHKRSIRKLQQTFKQQLYTLRQSIALHFPAGTRISDPDVFGIGAVHAFFASMRRIYLD